MLTKMMVAKASSLQEFYGDPMLTPFTSARTLAEGYDP